MPSKSKSKITKKTKLAIIVLICIIFIIVLGHSIQFVRSLFSPITAQSYKRGYSWNEKYNFNLIIKTDSLALLSYNATQRSVKLINIPDELYIDVTLGYGKWQVRSVYELGQTNLSKNGSELVKSSLTNFFGVPIDGFLEFGSYRVEKNSKEALEYFRQKPYDLINFKNLNSDLTPWELNRLRWAISKVRFDKISIFNLVDVLGEENLPDGTVVLVGDPVKVDSVLANLEEGVVKSERLTIAIYNSTDKPLLAQKAARIIRNMGGNIVVTSNASKPRKSTIVIGSQSDTLQRLSQIFNSKEVSKDDSDCSKAPKCDTIICAFMNKKQSLCEVSDSEVELSRAQINIVLGEDFYLKY